jgi:hypothetical protein
MPMTSAHARISVASSFIVMSIVGGGCVFSYWFGQSTAAAVGRSTTLFVVTMACVHLAGFMLYVKQDIPKSAEEVARRELFEFSPRYWPALKQAISLQMVFGVLTGLMLDMGRSFGFFKVALVGHCLGILLIIGRRPLSPTKWDIFFIRFGVLLLLIFAGLFAPLVWSIIGESHLSGWQRLWGR